MHPPVAHQCPTGDAPRRVCRGEALPRPPAPHGAAMRRGRHVSPDTQRRPAEQPSPRSPGRKRSGFSPGRSLPTTPAVVITVPPHPLASICRPSGPAGQAPPDPYKRGSAPHRGAHVPDRGRIAPPCRGEALPRPPAPEARQCIVAHTSRPTRSADQPSSPLHDGPAVNGRASAPGVRCRPPRPWSSPHPGTHWHALLAPVDRRVTQRLTPTRRGACPTAAGRRPTAAAAFPGVGATRGLPRGRVRRWPGQRATMMRGQA
jgi:hypothetical protein